MKLAIIGSRTLTVDDLSPFLPDNITEIVTGGAKGIDTCARCYAEANGIHLTEFLPDYARYGRGAPHVRNRAIVDYADAVLALWDGKSRGTASVIAYSQKAGKPVTVHRL